MYKTRTIESKKTLFSLDHHCFLLVPKSPLKLPWRSRTLGPLGDLHGTSPGRRVPAGSTRLENPITSRISQNLFISSEKLKNKYNKWIAKKNFVIEQNLEIGSGKMKSQPSVIAANMICYWSVIVIWTTNHLFFCLFVCLFGFFFKQIGSKFEWRRNNKRLSYLEGIKKGRKVKTQFKSISNTTKKPLKSNKFFREPVTYFFSSWITNDWRKKPGYLIYRLITAKRSYWKNLALLLATKTLNIYISHGHQMKLNQIHALTK